MTRKLYYVMAASFVLGFCGAVGMSLAGVYNDKADSPEDQIIAVLTVQAKCWNEGDLDGFMEHYWKSDDLTFSSGGTTQRGWDETYERYQKRYPTAERMGQLEFSDLEIRPLGDSAALVLGRWHLERNEEPIGGNFTLVVEKHDENWVIIHDHTSAGEAE